MSREAKKWLKEYKRLFNEVSAYNKGQSEGAKKIEKLGRLDKGKLTLLGTNKEAENTLLRALNAENAQKSTLTNINKENMHVSDSGERYAFTNSKSGKANDTLQDYSDELLDLIEERGDYIVDNYEKLKEVVNIAFDKPKIKATAYFGIINIATLQKIEKSIPNLPKEFDGKLFKEGKQYSVAATFDSIRHLVDDKKMTRDDVIDYLNRLADTIVDFETATFDYYTDSYGKKNNGILFKKKFDDGTMVSFDLVSNKKRSLSLVTLYLNSADYQKKKAAETPLMQKTSAHTPEARVSQPSAVSIHDSARKSNSFGKKTSKDFKNGAESGKNVDDGSRSALKKGEKEYRDKVNARAEAKIAKATAKAEARADRAIETKSAQLKAEYTTDKVFPQNSVKSGFESVSEVKALPGKERETIARDLWLELEASDSQDVRDTFILKYSVKLYDAIKNADYEAYENMTMKEKDALREKLNAAVKKIVSSGRKSKGAKIREDIKAEEQVAGEIKSKIYQSLKKIDDIKKERFLAASAYKSDEFKDTLEKLTKIDWRGKFSVLAKFKKIAPIAKRI